jgi:hypothetical protein
MMPALRPYLSCGSTEETGGLCGDDRTVLDARDLEAGLRGTAYAAGEDGYDEASRAWNLNASQEPALVVMAEGAADVMAAVSSPGSSGWASG